MCKSLRAPLGRVAWLAALGLTVLTGCLPIICGQNDNQDNANGNSNGNSNANDNEPGPNRPAPGDAPQPPANLRLSRFGSHAGDSPSVFELRWDADAPADGWCGFTVYRSGTAFDAAEEALIAGQTGGDARSLTVELPPGSGVVHMRVSGTACSGAESALSSPFIADTTERLVFAGDVTIHHHPTLAFYSATFDPDAAELRATRVQISPSAGGAPGTGDRYPDFAVTPDGRRVAYAVSRYVSPDTANHALSLYVAPLDGSQPPHLISGNLHVHTAWYSTGTFGWSPDATRLAFVSPTGSGDDRLYVAAADGATPPRAISGAVSLGDKARTAALEWSPDGRWIAFVGRTNGTGVLYAVPADGSAPPLRISDNPPELSVTAFGWSPDGRYLAYSRPAEWSPGRRPGEIGRAFLADVSAPLPNRQVCSGYAGVMFRGWTKDARHVLFSTNAPDRLVLVPMDAAAPEREIASGWVSGLAWSRSRERIAYVTRTSLIVTDPDSGSVRHWDEVFVTRLDDPQPLRVGHAPQVADLRWSPDGRLVSFSADDPHGSETTDSRIGYRVDPEVVDGGPAFTPKFVVPPLWIGVSPGGAFACGALPKVEGSPWILVDRLTEATPGQLLVARSIDFSKAAWSAPGAFCGERQVSYEWRIGWAAE